jgi:hypothetical protein
LTPKLNRFRKHKIGRHFTFVWFQCMKPLAFQLKNGDIAEFSFIVSILTYRTVLLLLRWKIRHHRLVSSILHRLCFQGSSTCPQFDELWFFCWSPLLLDSCLTSPRVYVSEWSFSWTGCLQRLIEPHLPRFVIRVFHLLDRKWTAFPSCWALSTQSCLVLRCQPGTHLLHHRYWWKHPAMWRLGLELYTTVIGENTPPCEG